MKRNINYNTKQRELILEIIKKDNKQFTVKNIYDKLCGKVGLTTIYRLVDRLVADRVINKNIGKNNVTYYQYLEKCEEDNHFFLKCDGCGKLIHIDCDCISDLSSHIFKHHKFKANKENVIIYGKCNKCIKGGN